MTALRQRVLEDMQLRGLTENTQKAYVLAIAGFAKHFGKSPAELDAENVRSYLLYLIKRGEVPKAKMARSALRFLYVQTLRKDWKILQDPFPKSERRLPIILSIGEVAELFHSLESIKYRAIFMTAYAAGLRASETVHLKVEDIDSERMQICML